VKGRKADATMADGTWQRQRVSCVAPHRPQLAQRRTCRNPATSPCPTAGSTHARPTGCSGCKAVSSPGDPSIVTKHMAPW